MAAVFTNDGKDAWAALHQGILRGLQGPGELKGVLLQPLQVAERADWDTSNSLLNLYREQRIANQVPTWNAVYFPNSGVNVPDEYQAFLDQLNGDIVRGAAVADPARLKQLDDERRAAQDRLQKNEYHINKEWDRYVANNRGKPPLSRAEWEVQFGFSASRQNLQSQVNMSLAAYMREVNTAGGDLLEVGRALGAMADPRARLPLPQDEDDAQLPPDSWQYWYRAGLSDDIQQFLRTTNSWDIEISDAAQRTNRFEDRWSGGASVSYFGLFGASGSVSNETIKTHAETDTRRIAIHFENIQSFPIDRGSWFKAGLIARFRDRMPPGFWAEGGRLNLIPTSVVLVRGVRIEVETSSEVTDYYFNKRTAGGGGGFSIGPWRVGGSANRTTIEEQYSMDRTAAGFVIQDTSGRAQVLAVASVRNLDLLTVPVPNPAALYAQLSAQDLTAGRMALRAAQFNHDVALSEFGLSIPARARAARKTS